MRLRRRAADCAARTGSAVVAAEAAHAQRSDVRAHAGSAAVRIEHFVFVATRRSHVALRADGKAAGGHPPGRPGTCRRREARGRRTQARSRRRSRSSPRSAAGAPASPRRHRSANASAATRPRGRSAPGGVARHRAQTVSQRRLRHSLSGRTPTLEATRRTAHRCRTARADGLGPAPRSPAAVAARPCRCCPRRPASPRSIRATRTYTATEPAL